MNESTVDEQQMKKFDSLSSNWWKIAPLKEENQFIFNYIAGITSEKKLVNDILVLDVGCGGGFLTEPLAQHGFKVVGIDLNLSLLKVAENHAQESTTSLNLTYKHESIEDHAVSNSEAYDIIVLNFVLQHAKNHEILLKNCVKCLKSGGLLFVTSAAKTYRAWLSVIILPELFYRYIPRNAHNWHNFINASEVDSILRKNQCVVNETKGLYYNPLWKYWSWNNHVDGGFYFIYATKM